MTDLDDLIARLEAADGPSNELNGEIWWAVFRKEAEAAFWRGALGVPHRLGDVMPPGLGRTAVIATAPRFTASLDAALTLVPRGSLWGVCFNAIGALPRAQVAASETAFADEAVGATAALALCIAALKARRAGAR